MNVKNQNVYSDKFILSVVDLTQIELATEEDKQYQIDYRASLFKAETWEDLKMIAEKNECMQEATETLYMLNADDLIREQCLARQDYYRTQYAYNKLLREQTEELQAKDKQLKSKDRELESKDRELQAKDKELQSKDKELQSKDKELHDLSEALKDKDNALAEKDKIIAKLMAEKAAKEEI